MQHTTAFKNQFIKNLDALISEVKLYADEKKLWATGGQISNTAGTLALHLNGNLNHFIGAQLGQTGYVRQREKEFADRDVPAPTIITMLEQTRAMLEQVFDRLKEEDLEKVFPLDNFGAGKTVYEALLLLLAHLNYHLGQINYHRRLIG